MTTSSAYPGTERCASTLPKGAERRGRGALTAWNMIDERRCCLPVRGWLDRSHWHRRPLFQALTVRHSRHTQRHRKQLSPHLPSRNGPLIAHIPHFDAETVLQFENGSIFLMAADGRCVHALHSTLYPEAR